MILWLKTLCLKDIFFNLTVEVMSSKHIIKRQQKGSLNIGDILKLSMQSKKIKK